MGKFISVSIRLPVETHQKLKIMSAVESKPMNELIIAWVEKQKVSIPGYTKTDEPQKKKPAKAQKTGKRKDENPNADEELIKAEILKHKAAGLSLQKIADALQADGIKTLRGGTWGKGTIDGLLRKYAKEDAQSG